MSVSSLPFEVFSERLALRAPRPQDAQAIFDAYLSRPEASLHMAWAPARGLNDASLLITRCLQRNALAKEKTYLLELRAEPGAVVGQLAIRTPGKATAELGYVLAPEHWGRGLMPEAVRAVVETVFADSWCARVQARCGTANTASVRTLEKAGFSREKLLDKHLVLPVQGPEPVDAWLYSRMR